jgi:hypothetical protein
MKWQILEVSLPFMSFLHAYDRKRGHNMLTLMFDPRFESMKLTTGFLSCENGAVIVVEYDQELLLPLLT